MILARRRKLQRLRAERAATNARRSLRHARDQAWALYDQLPHGPCRIAALDALHPRLFGRTESADYYRNVCRILSRAIAAQTPQAVADDKKAASPAQKVTA